MQRAGEHHDSSQDTNASPKAHPSSHAILFFLVQRFDASVLYCLTMVAAHDDFLGPLALALPPTLRETVSQITEKCLDAVQPKDLSCYTASTTALTKMRIVAILLAPAFFFCARILPAHAQVPAGASQIQHIVFILKENHTFDNYFGSVPGTDGASTGRIHTGKIVPLTRAPDDPQGDIWHTWHYALLAMDDGKMDRFDLIKGARQFGFLYAYTQYQADQLPNYFAYVHQFVLGDEFFSSVHGPSFPNHLYTIGAQSGGAIGNPVGGGVGCDAPSNTTVQVMNPTTGVVRNYTPVSTSPRLETYSRQLA